MKSRQEYFYSHKLWLTIALSLYCFSLFLLDLCFFVSKGYATIFVIMSIALMGGIICHIMSHQAKEFLFCPKCGSKNIVKTGLLGLPISITDECPDCHSKIVLDKSIRLD